MLTVEDCLLVLERICLTGADPLEISNQWDRRFIADVAGHALSGSPISTAQGTIVLKLIDRYSAHLEAEGVGRERIAALLQSPNYKTPPYQSTHLPREARWMGDNKVALRFKFNASIMEDVKRLKGVNHFLAAQYPVFIRDHKIWILDINAGNIDAVMDLIRRHRFTPDDQTIEYFLQASNSLGQKPEVGVEDNQIAITVRDDNFLNAWVNLIKQLEN